MNDGYSSFDEHPVTQWQDPSMNVDPLGNGLLLRAIPHTESFERV
jgi:hypothetical protein